jgi:hypothetical protein
VRTPKLIAARMLDLAEELDATHIGGPVKDVADELEALALDLDEAANVGRRRAGAS